MNYPKVGLVLINYKNYAQEFLANCLESIKNLDYPKEKLSLYLVDNQTSQESQKFLKENFSGLNFIFNPQNSGWAGGNNLGIAQGLKDGCEDFVFLNMDTVLRRDWLKKLVEAAYQEERIGIVQSKIYLYEKDKNQNFKINSLGNCFHYLGFGYCSGEGQKESQLMDWQPKEICYASGASMYVKGKVIQEIGFFDEDFFMYHDDTEFCFRARQAGWKIILAPESILWHKYDFYRNKSKIYFIERNRFLVLFYFLKWPTILLILPSLFFVELSLLFFSLINGWWKEKLRSLFYFAKWSHLKLLWKKRKTIQTRRKISDREFTRYFSDQLIFLGREPFFLKILNIFSRFYWKICYLMIFW